MRARPNTMLNISQTFRRVRRRFRKAWWFIHDDNWADDDSIKLWIARHRQARADLQSMCEGKAA